MIGNWMTSMKVVVGGWRSNVNRERMDAINKYSREYVVRGEEI